MCGIIAYTGKREAAPVLFEGLKKLEYRGYDSAGICTLREGQFSLVKRAGRVENIAYAASLAGRCGIGHTRWATHGEASDRNAHPHLYRRFAIVHNGVIENYAALKAELVRKGHVFASDTDSETIAHLLEEYYRGDFLAAVQKTAARLSGSFALCILCRDCEDTVVCVRKKSPLLVGTDGGGFYAASDLPALGDCRKVFSLSDGEIALLTGERAQLYDFSLSPRPLVFEKNASCAADTGKGAFGHYMLKEIYEIPQAVKDTAESFDYRMAESLARRAGRFSHVDIIGCGTAYHSALTGALLLEKELRLPVFALLAGEFTIRPLPPDKNTLVIAVSQSGETADTLLAARYALERGATLAVVTNVAHSSLAALADWLFLTQAGTEVAVAATKTYEAQLTEFYLLSDFFAGRKTSFLSRFARTFGETLTLLPAIKRTAQRLSSAQNVWFIGRGADYPSAVEGSLKLREVSYLSGAGYESGELKHGSLALIDERASVVAIVTQKALRQKSETAIREVRSRGARVFCVTPFADCPAQESFLLPRCPQKYYPLVAQIPLQLLAYHTALARGIDPDRPRNLAKSVTVE